MTPAMHVSWILLLKALVLSEVAESRETQNVALNRRTLQISSDFNGVSDKAVDGNTNMNFFGRSCSHTARGEPGAWWMVDLDAIYNIDVIKIWNRADCCWTRLSDFTISVSSAALDNTAVFSLCLFHPGWFTGMKEFQFNDRTCVGRTVKVQQHETSPEPLQLCEIQIFGGREELHASSSLETEVYSSMSQRRFLTLSISTTETAEHGLASEQSPEAEVSVFQSENVHHALATIQTSSIVTRMQPSIESVPATSEWIRSLTSEIDSFSVSIMTPSSSSYGSLKLYLSTDIEHGSSFLQGEYGSNLSETYSVGQTTMVPHTWKSTDRRLTEDWPTSKDSITLHLSPYSPLHTVRSPSSIPQIWPSTDIQPTPSSVGSEESLLIRSSSDGELESSVSLSKHTTSSFVVNSSHRSKLFHPMICCCPKTSPENMLTPEKIKTRLTLNKSSLSQQKRKKTSAENTKLSADYIGGVGVIMIVITATAIIAPDCVSFFQWYMRQMHYNK